MSKKHLKMSTVLSFSGTLSATLQKLLHYAIILYVFPEHCRPFGKGKSLNTNAFRSIVGHLYVKSSIFALNQTGKVVWQEQSLI